GQDRVGSDDAIAGLVRVGVAQPGQASRNESVPRLESAPRSSFQGPGLGGDEIGPKRGQRSGDQYRMVGQGTLDGIKVEAARFWSLNAFVDVAAQGARGKVARYDEVIACGEENGVIYKLHVLAQAQDPILHHT